MGVSIIIPAYNTEEYLSASLESVLGQTVRDWEAIVINDGSTDQTGTIAETYSRQDPRIRVLHQEKSGIAEARNRGFAMARADYEYCMFLDSDDLLDPDTLEILLQALDRDPEAVGAHGYCRYIDREGKPMAIDGNYFLFAKRSAIQGYRLKVCPPSAPTTFEVLAYANAIPTGGMLMRRAHKEAAGDFDPSFVMADDYHFWLRLSRLGHIAFVNRAVMSYRRHEGNITHRRRLMLESLHLARKKMYTSADLDDREKRIMLTGYRYHELFRAFVNFEYATNELTRAKLINTWKEFRTGMKHILSSLKGDF